MIDRALWTELHGLFFGLFFLLATYALVLECVRYSRHLPLPENMAVWERVYLVGASICGWFAVITGTFVVYPWYRAPMVSGDIRLHPKFFLLAHAHTAPLHSIGMEWKEHVALLAPLAFTAAAFVWTRCRVALREEPVLRKGVLVFACVALFATGIAGITGAFLNKSAPVESSISSNVEGQ